MRREEFSKNKKIIILAAVLFFTFMWVYRPHYDYRLPLHADEWISISSAKLISHGEDIEDKYHMGFLLFISWLGKTADISKVYHLLPALWACVSSFALFILVSRKTNFYTGIFAMIFFAFLPSNINILGIEFFVAMTFSIPFLYIFALFFTEGLEDNNIKKIISCIVALFIIALIHPSMAMLAFISSSAYLLVKRDQAKSAFQNLNPWLLSIPGLTILWVFYLFWKNNIFSTLKEIFSKLVFRIDYITYHVNYFIPALYGWIHSLFAIIGIFKALKKKNMLFFISWVSTGFALILFFIIFKFSIFASYQRTIYFTFLGLVPLSAYGLESFFRKTKKYIPGFLILIILFSSLVYLRYEPREGLKPSPIINEKEHEIIEFISGLEKGTVIAPLRESLAVSQMTPHNITLNRKFYLEPSSLKIAELMAFYSDSLNCTEKKKMLEEKNAEYIWSKEKIECDFTELFYNGDYVYEFDKFTQGTLKYECEYEGELVECELPWGEKGVQECQEYEEWGKRLKECLPYECEYHGQITECTTEKGEKGLQKCSGYKGYGTALGECLDIELKEKCIDNTTLIDCKLNNGEKGFRGCLDNEKYGFIVTGCWPKQCYDEKGEFLDCYILKNEKGENEIHIKT